MQNKLLPILCFLFFALKSYAQPKPLNISQADARFTLSATRNSGFGSENYKFYVQNNTSQEYRMVIKVTLDLACVGEKSFTLGYNNIVSLKPNGKFDAFDNDNVHIYLYNVEKDKNCLIKEGDRVTLFRGISYTISDIKNITQEQAAAEKKKQADDLAKQQKLEAEKKQKADEAAKAATAKKEKETKEKAEAEKKKKDAEVAKKEKETKEKVEVEKKKKEQETKASASTSTQAKSSTAGKQNSSKTSSSTAKENAQKKADAEAKAYQEKQEAKREAEAAAKEEQDKLNQKQADYDKWKADAKNDQATNDAASAGAVGAFMFILGQWIYNDNMGIVNPAYSFTRSGNKAQLGVEIDFGYSLSSYPILFGSEINTVVGGRNVNKKEIQPKSPFLLNFDPTIKLGVENNNFGGYGYINAKLGISPIFDADNFALQYGARLYAGIKWVKAYVDMSSGSRTVNKSSTDPEESGSGKSDTKFSKLEYGIRFTTHPTDDLRRSHIYLGIISEKITQESNNAMIDPISGALYYKSDLPTLTGYTIQWNKEHTFKLYANIYPNFIYTGNVNGSNGSLSSDFSSTPTNMFLEFGFVRAVNWW